MEPKQQPERLSKLEVRHSKNSNITRYKSTSPVKPRSVSPKEKKSLNLSFDKKQWNRDMEKLTKQEQALLKAIKDLNTRYNAAKARINQSKKNLIKEDIQETKTKEIEKSLLQIDSKLKKLKQKHIRSDSIKKSK
jgi:hypothetical protein